MRRSLDLAMGLVVVAGLTACESAEVTPIEMTAAALSTPLTTADVLGFEVAESWNGSGATLAFGAPASQGQASLAVSKGNYVALASSTLASLGQVSSPLKVDVRVPTVQPNPYWLGALQVYVTIPSRGVYSLHLGQRELTGLVAGQWTTLEYPLDASTVTLLRSTYSDLTITLALNTPYGTDPYRLDNLRFAGTGALTPVEEVLQIIASQGIYTSPNKQRNRDLLRQPLGALTVTQSTELMDIIRGQGNARRLVDALLDVRPSVVNPDRLYAHWYEIFEVRRGDWQVELLTYTDFNSSASGFFCAGNSVYIYDYAACDSGTVMHESNHSFNFTHGLGGLSGLNEGSSITILSSWKNLAETVFGTVLYYRDIGLGPDYPRDIAIGDANVYDSKGRDFLRSVMATDESKVNWFDPVEVQTIFDLFWKPLNRNVDWDSWVTAANQATAAGLAWIAQRRPL